MFCLRVANTLITTVYCPKSVPLTSQSGRNTVTWMRNPQGCSPPTRRPCLWPQHSIASLSLWATPVFEGSFLHSPRLCVPSSLPCSLVFGFPSMHVPVQASPIRLCAVGGQKQDLLSLVSLKLFKHK